MTILGGNPAELCAVLDGVAESGAYGYDATTDERVLYVPHWKAGDAAQAVLLCRGHGLLRSTLEKMNNAAANYWYLTTIARPGKRRFSTLR